MLFMCHVGNKIMAENAKAVRAVHNHALISKDFIELYT